MVETEASLTRKLEVINKERTELAIKLKEIKHNVGLQSLIGDTEHEANMKRFLDTSGGTKYDSERPDMSLLSSFAIEELAKALTVGKKKYAAHNWRKGISISRLIAAALRHTFALLRGEDKDPETGLYHASQVMCNMMFILETMKYHSEMDDRFVVVNRNTQVPAAKEVLHQSV